VAALKSFLTKTNTMSTYKDLLAFKKAFALAMKILKLQNIFLKKKRIALLTR